MFGRRYKRRACFGKTWLALCTGLAIFIVYRFVIERGSALADRKDSYLLDLTLNRRILADVNATCKRPALALWPPEVRSTFRIRKPPVCDNEDWIIVRNGTFYVDEKIERKYGKVSCMYYPITFKTDYKSTLGDGVLISNGKPLISDFFEVKCSASSAWSSHVQAYPGVIQKVPALSQTSPTWPKRGFPLNILMVGYDSVSRLNWIRNMPESYKYFVDHLQGVVLEGYNIVGDGTPQALLPILTGQTETELPEARWGYSDAKEIDDHPWIWRDLKKLGYVTQWAEDYISTGSFQMRMKGFAKQPVDHYYRAFLQWVDSYKLWLPNCLGSKSRNARILDWSHELFIVYPSTPKFSFVFQGELSHNSLDHLQMADLELKDFLSRMHTDGHLDNTLLILMSDHGLRAGSFRSTQQGKYEERLPFFGLRLPTWFREQYPKETNNLAKNVFRLTTPFDIHATFKHLTNFRPGQKPKILTRGMSLLDDIPNERDCDDADIPSHWCTCLDTTKLSTSDPVVLKAANTLVDAMNEILFNATDKCSKLRLHKISSASKMTAQKSVLKFRGSKDRDGRKADLSGYSKESQIYYQVVIETLPGNAQFDATVRQEGSKFKVDFKSVSRINIYGNQSKCITNEYPHLRPYCYCK